MSPQPPRPWRHRAPATGSGETQIHGTEVVKLVWFDDVWIFDVFHLLHMETEEGLARCDLVVSSLLAGAASWNRVFWRSEVKEIVSAKHLLEVHIYCQLLFWRVVICCDDFVRERHIEALRLNDLWRITYGIGRNRVPPRSAWILAVLGKIWGSLGFSWASNFASDPHNFRLLRIVLMLWGVPRAKLNTTDTVTTLRQGFENEKTTQIEGMESVPSPYSRSEWSGIRAGIFGFLSISVFARQ